MEVTAQALGAVRRHPIWKLAADQVVRSLLRASRMEDYRPAEIILQAGKPANQVFLLLEGAVRVFHSQPKQEGLGVTVKVFSAPACFGEDEATLRGVCSVNVETLTHATLLIAPAGDYFQILQLDAAACFRQFWDVSQRFAVAIGTERAAHFDDVMERLVTLIASYAAHFGKETGEGVLIEHPLTQDGIATQIRSNRRSVVRAMAALYKEGRIKRRGRRILVPNPALLIAMGRPSSSGFSFRTSDVPWAERRK